jgi:murein tripeptide amidase MpaA
LTTKYGTDAEITALLDYADWLITPVSNPDGYEYTWTTVYFKIKIKMILVLKIYLCENLELITGSFVAQKPHTGN